MVSGTGVIIGEDLIEGHSWTMGVVLLVTVGVGLLCCRGAIFDLQLSIGNVHVTGETEVARQPRGVTLRSARIKIINRPKEKMWSLSRYSGDQLRQLMMSNKRSLCGKLVQFLRYIAIMNENQINVCPILVLSSRFGWTTSGDDCWYQSKVASCSRTGMPSCKISWSS